MLDKIENYDLLFKIVLVGDSLVGKTNIIRNYLSNEFSPETKPTIGIEFGSKNLNLNNKIIKLQIWDTAGQEKYRSITLTYCKGANGFFIIYDITKKQTFDNIEIWINLIKENIHNEDINIILLGNKSDLNDKREISFEEDLEKAKKYNFGFCEVSALNGNNIKYAVFLLFKEIFKIYEFKNKLYFQLYNYKIQDKEEEEDEDKDDEEDEYKDFFDKKEEIIIKKKCSSKNHKEFDAISYCQECKIYMCNKCVNYHSILFENHSQFNLDKNKDEFFINKCLEKNHNNELQYFCKTHNKLICSSCICKIKSKGNGKHKNCDVCSVEEIKYEKKNKLEENKKYLKELSKALEQSIIELKKSYEKINEKKKELKLNIQKIFTKIRNTFNQREDDLLLEVEKRFEEKFFKNNLIKISEELPNKVKKSLENRKISDNEWNNNEKIITLINECIIIEKNIKNIFNFNDKVKKFNSTLNFKFKFYPNENEINNILEKLKKFGEIKYNEEKINQINNNDKK